MHTILSGDTTDSAQLLLLGHRRIKREATVSAQTLHPRPYTPDPTPQTLSQRLLHARGGSLARRQAPVF